MQATNHSSGMLHHCQWQFRKPNVPIRNIEKLIMLHPTSEKSRAIQIQLKTTGSFAMVDFAQALPSVLGSPAIEWGILYILRYYIYVCVLLLVGVYIIDLGKFGLYFLALWSDITNLDYKECSFFSCVCFCLTILIFWENTSALILFLHWPPRGHLKPEVRVLSGTLMSQLKIKRGPNFLYHVVRGQGTW